ncbi:hypothetical protein LDENG_00272920 [Lucifuga dentata]|nr:hypothetical protein LDENG_00272920 [Lucifuga dentata]
MKAASGSMLILCLFTVSECSIQKVVGRTGQDVTLPCEYDVSTNGPLAVCWGRAEIPRQGCSQRILLTDGRSVEEESRTSVRYQLLGNLDAGDVSLTILNATQRDAGRYGCRVQILGLFNDQKHHVDLTINDAAETTTSTTTHTHTVTEHTPANYTQGHMTTDSRSTSSLTSGPADEVRTNNTLRTCFLFSDWIWAKT